VTKPFKFEERLLQASTTSSAARLRGHDHHHPERAAADDHRPHDADDRAFATADDATAGDSGISDHPGPGSSTDFADVKTIMSGMGLAMMGTGIAEGRIAMEAARRAISSRCSKASVNGSRGVIINVTGGPDLSLVEVCEASSPCRRRRTKANIIFGAVVDPNLKGKVKITVIRPVSTRVGDAAIAPPVTTLTCRHTSISRGCAEQVSQA
jgi:cell division protein FtsZ